MLSQKNFSAFAGILKNFDILEFNENDTHLSYLPLAHILENICVLAMFVFGGRICPFSGDVKNIKNDIELVKPTFFMSVPRLYNRFYDAVKDKFDKTEGLKKSLLDRALNTKLNAVKSTGQYTHMVYDRVVFNKTKQLFGGNCRFMASGSAPLIPEVHAFMKVIACAPLL
jgi:long-chain acyl-CoA synthetase